MAAERILVVDADRETALLIAQTLEHDGLSVRTVTNCADAVAAIGEFRPALVISNATSCGADGIALGRALESYALPTLLLTMRDVLYSRRAMLTRARSLVSGERSASEGGGIVERLEAPVGHPDTARAARPTPLVALLPTAGDESAISGSTAQPALALDAERSDVYVNGHAAHLTPTEFGIISHLVAAHGDIVTYDWLLQHIWGAAYRGDRHLLQVHMQRLRLKLENAGAPRHAVRNRWGVGYAVDTQAVAGTTTWNEVPARQLAG